MIHTRVGVRVASWWLLSVWSVKMGRLSQLGSVGGSSAYHSLIHRSSVTCLCVSLHSCGLLSQGVNFLGQSDYQTLRYQKIQPARGKLCGRILTRTYFLGSDNHARRITGQVTPYQTPWVSHILYPQLQACASFVSRHLEVRHSFVLSITMRPRRHLLRQTPQV